MSTNFCYLLRVSHKSFFAACGDKVLLLGTGCWLGHLGQQILSGSVHGIREENALDCRMVGTPLCCSHHGKEMLVGRGVGFLDRSMLTMHVLTRGHLLVT
jgi:hypothetical protein